VTNFVLGAAAMFALIAGCMALLILFSKPEEQPAREADEDPEQCVRDMLLCATTNHLGAEVIQTYTEEIRAGKSVQEACWCALYEWDCLPLEVSGGQRVDSAAP
jgi:hypothetical protein